MKKIVAFVCIHNSCRSQMAEGFAKALGSEVIEAYSAGTEEYPGPKPMAVEVMEDAGIDMSNHTSKLLSDIPEKLDILIHPNSLVHAIVELKNGLVKDSMAYLSQNYQKIDPILIPFLMTRVSLRLSGFAIQPLS